MSITFETMDGERSREMTRMYMSMIMDMNSADGRSRKYKKVVIFMDIIAETKWFLDMHPMLKSTILDKISELQKEADAFGLNPNFKVYYENKIFGKKHCKFILRKGKICRNETNDKDICLSHKRFIETNFRNIALFCKNYIYIDSYLKREILKYLIGF